MPTVFVTGANRGLGFEFARQYSADGWRVIGTCRNPDRAESLRALGSSVSIHPLDVTDRGALADLARELENETFDLCIANAGVMPSTPETLPEDIDDAAWAEAFRVNTVAPLACACSFVKHVARSRGRTMVAMGSWIGSIASNTVGGHYVYRASKSALNAVWRSFAIDHPEVIAVVLSPGAVRTDMTRYWPDRWSKLPTPAERVSLLRPIIANLKQADSGGFFHFTGEELPW